jgi:hypothetical protein
MALTTMLCTSHAAADRFAVDRAISLGASDSLVCLACRSRLALDLTCKGMVRREPGGGASKTARSQAEPGLCDK